MAAGRKVLRVITSVTHCLLTQSVRCGQPLVQNLYCFCNAPGHSLSYEAEICSASEKMPCIVLNFKVHHHIHKNPPSVPVLSQMNQFDAVCSVFFEVLLNAILIFLL
jgi:hypothetical protein